MTLTDRPLYLSPPDAFPRWQVEQYEGHRDLIRFTKWGRSGAKGLDQVARWVSAGWDSSRWVPKPPTVPVPVLRAVMAELVRREVVG